MPLMWVAGLLVGVEVHCKEATQTSNLNEQPKFLKITTRPIFKKHENHKIREEVSFSILGSPLNFDKLST